jgi:hypothetical protein
MARSAVKQGAGGDVLAARRVVMARDASRFLRANFLLTKIHVLD